MGASSDLFISADIKKMQGGFSNKVVSSLTICIQPKDIGIIPACTSRRSIFDNIRPGPQKNVLPDTRCHYEETPDVEEKMILIPSAGKRSWKHRKIVS